MKLSPAQVALLRFLWSGGPAVLWENYGPLKVLVRLGLVEKYSGSRAVYRITEAGAAEAKRLSKEENHERD